MANTTKDPHAPDQLPGKGFENNPDTVKTGVDSGKENAPIEVPDQNQTPQNIPEKS